MENLPIIGAVVAAIAFLVMLIAGASNKVVIYFNVKDLVISFMPWVLVLLGMIIPELAPDALAGLELYVLYGCLTVAALFIIWSVRLSIFYNQNLLLGLTSGVFKVLISLVGLLIVVGQMGKIFSKDSGGKDKIIALVVFGLFFWLGKKLINGHEVYLAKGWSLPEQEAKSA